MIQETRVPVLLLVLVVGLAVGSIAKMLAYRGPREGPMLNRLFGCPDCGRALTWRDRMPVLPYLVGRGRRKTCGDPVRIREPVIEIIVALAWVLATARFGFRPELPAFLAFFTALVILSAVDLEHRRILNRVLGPMAVVAIVLLGMAALVEGQPGALGRAAVGALAYFLPMLLLGVIIPTSMGMGDIKLAGYLGFHLGWFSLAHVLFGAFLGFLIGALIGVGLIIAGKKGRMDYVPFGPSMAVGAALMVLIGAR